MSTNITRRYYKVKKGKTFSPQGLVVLRQNADASYTLGWSALNPLDKFTKRNASVIAEGRLESSPILIANIFDSSNVLDALRELPDKLTQVAVRLIGSAVRRRIKEKVGDKVV